MINPTSLEVCELFCDASSFLWPKPTGHLSLSKNMVQFDPDKIRLDDVQSGTQIKYLLERNIVLLKNIVKNIGGKLVNVSGMEMLIRCKGYLEMNNIKLTLHTDESYNLTVIQMDKTVSLSFINEFTSHQLLLIFNKFKLEVTITAKSYFGIRHGLETLSQLIVFDDLRNQIQIPNEISIIDGPVYPYRGVLLDTSRNFIDKTSILRTIDGMAMSKLNTLHWHITDSHSFPYVSKTWPEFSKFGSYATDKIYNQEDVKEIVEYGLIHGVRVLPEFDAPAHVGEGWQWVENDTIVCFKAKPWTNYCVEPPCGQLNPTSEKVYEILEGIYKDMIHDFQSDLFHMGGDEVNINCWNSSAVITNWMQIVKNWDLSESSFYMLWHYFQQRAMDKLKIANDGKDISIILWSSAWIGEGNNWCTPYKGWQVIYDNSPLKIIKLQHLESKRHLILAAFAERLWAEPSSTWIHAEQRMLRHRERLVKGGISAESLQPEWCSQNQGLCQV
ncbi:Chitooligosaccharidolytic beta-N-acetylglucosaminidase [Melipona quadrifasciata]|uniref:Beta-hexosaminidase n=1 Tax=Melipona quadrifasciata TaxID=166423 RepID=A0A0N0BGD6_9HYME|nr:Chitooligosaccharidolytic beta-N-acetylglucosaminidase [Melipona quadrifasciata]